ncbi:hypothetical protein M0R45_008727 [Rubus argutus]|uniref:Uncharacterized protein n=1 Tax=Rubus argutus TaxID=59490 RepID=A0AAW1Y5C4_RUBAR
MQSAELNQKEQMPSPSRFSASPCSSPTFSTQVAAAPAIDAIAVCTAAFNFSHRSSSPRRRHEFSPHQITAARRCN